MEFVQQDAGLCIKLEIPTSVFFCDLDHTVQVARAKSYCNRCSIQEHCGQVAINNRDPHGIWGGLTPDDRSNIRLRSALDQHSSQRRKKHGQLHPEYEPPSSLSYKESQQNRSQGALHSDFVQRLVAHVNGIAISQILSPEELSLGPSQRNRHGLYLVGRENSQKQPDPIVQTFQLDLTSLRLGTLP